MRAAYLYPGIAKLVSRLVWECRGGTRDRARQNAAKPCDTCVCWISPGCRKRHKSGFDHRNDHRQKIFDFPPCRGIMAEIEYPGVAQLVGRDIWDVEVGCSSHLTRTKIPLKSTISEGFFLFFVYCGAGFELPYAFSLYSRFPWPASTTTIPSSASCCKRDSVRLKLVPRDLESANRSLVG